MADHCPRNCGLVSQHRPDGGACLIAQVAKLTRERDEARGWRFDAEAIHEEVAMERDHLEALLEEEQREHPTGPAHRAPEAACGASITDRNDEHRESVCLRPPAHADEHYDPRTGLRWTGPAHRAPDPALDKDPPPPDRLVGALQDRVHKGSGVFRGAKAHRKVAPPDADATEPIVMLAGCECAKHEGRRTCDFCIMQHKGAHRAPDPAPAVTREDVVEALRDVVEGLMNDPERSRGTMLRIRALLARIDAEGGRK